MEKNERSYYNYLVRLVRTPRHSIDYSSVKKIKSIEDAEELDDEEEWYLRRGFTKPLFLPKID